MKPSCQTPQASRTYDQKETASSEYSGFPVAHAIGPGVGAGAGRSHSHFDQVRIKEVELAQAEASSHCEATIEQPL
jgi:hypothetical protein